MIGSKLQNFIKNNKRCWWWVKKENLKNLSKETIIEGILNYGNWKSVMELFRIIGLKSVAKIFYNQTNIEKRRVNYRPQVINYFDLYFKKHVRGNFIPKTERIIAFNKKKVW